MTAIPRTAADVEADGDRHLHKARPVAPQCAGVSPEAAIGAIVAAGGVVVNATRHPRKNQLFARVIAAVMAAL
jgi:hypothetical protein